LEVSSSLDPAALRSTSPRRRPIVRPSNPFSLKLRIDTSAEMFEISALTLLPGLLFSLS
jgi:hypothetical protein